MTTRPKEPHNYLDQAVIRVALQRACKLIEKGFGPEEAARYACPGPWSEFESYLRIRLIGDQGSYQVGHIEEQKKRIADPLV